MLKDKVEYNMMTLIFQYVPINENVFWKERQVRRSTYDSYDGSLKMHTLYHIEMEMDIKK
jgi:hypothetical protein